MFGTYRGNSTIIYHYQTFIGYLHRLALQQGEIKSCSVEEGLAFESIKRLQSAGGSLAQQLHRESC